MENQYQPWSRSEHMKMLHQSGRYAGTSKIGTWNVSEERRQRMLGYRTQNALDKNSVGYGSEYHMRLSNRELLHNKFQGETGYLYYLDFPGSVKVGFSKDWERRLNHEILGGKVLMLISGPTDDLADLEFDTMIKFKQYTRLNQSGTRYTEFLDKSARPGITRFLREAVRKNPKLTIINNGI